MRLREWIGGKKHSMQFAVPMVCREPTNHVDNCYFCMTPPMNMGWSRKKKNRLQYPTGDLDLPKQKAELLASRWQQWNLLLPGFKITDYRTREKNIFHFFEKKEHVVVRIDVNGLMNFMDINYDSNNWRLFQA
ncbi:uncharacterized protein TNIN_321661 [Trichonephila inaurata madagascariensis]|uniref:Uncharacterized protein n=1 Tax=Trichonephila inaurata madagascariensis TaxID=2747483 RepID=A0A8X6YNZ8_9ARAC|nr:uncharacterized protein TNIN_321661 [Trichonephila inaurata madagascariensis]